MKKAGRPKVPIGERIDSMIQKKNGHWIWTGCLAGRNRPIIFNGSRKNPGKVNVRKFLYEKKYGKVAKYTPIVSNCSEKGCVKPSHCRVADDPSYNKLSMNQRRQIIKRYEFHLKRKITMQELADEYGCSKQAIEYVINGKTHS